MATVVVAGTGIAGFIALATGGPAVAAPGDASARGVVVDLSASVLGVPVVGANATIGSATAPAGGGTDSSTGLAVVVPGAVGVTASGTVLEVSATRGQDASLANSDVADLALGVLGVPVLDAELITAAVNCPRVGTPTADTNVVGLSLFGTPVVLVPNTPGVTASTAVTVPGLTGASLTVTLTGVETVTADTAAAVAVRASVQLTGSVDGGEVVDIPVGTVIVAEAACERPLAPTSPTASPTQPTASPTQPTASPTVSPTQPTASPTLTPTAPYPTPTEPTAQPHLPVTGGSAAGLLGMLGAGVAMVATGAVVLVISRRARRTTGA
ncbi:hypothetical protein [Micromonospora sp. HUAS LYJ1]|uniref:hypothetical protein n=1 Tax=Micromonospora sp. HUAS LYJ1 TaxID=3061626 RepID=UPI002672076E|nr:hypothetical protein [Micromonospora sp. HUAS LYJ1]WKU05201.1 hypothetical protein Q2K16_31365 [Micromonospora sp. HUAS LYJ1]